jgi:hypothetical protein
VARKERNLYGPGVVHDGGVPHGSSDDPVVRALVLLRPPGKALSLAPDASRTISESTSCCSQN